MSPGRRPSQPLPTPDQSSTPATTNATPTITRNFPSSFTDSLTDELCVTLDQVLLELSVVRAHAVEIFGRVVGGNHLRRHVGRPAEIFFDFFGKLRRVRGFQNRGGRVAKRFGFEPVEKPAPRHGAVRFE